MRKLLSLFALAASLGLSGAAFAQTTTVDDFDQTDQGDWTFGYSPGETLAVESGNTYLAVQGLDTVAPFLVTQDAGSVFTGNYRARNVFQIGIDVRIDHTDFGSKGRPFSLVLFNDNGTPTDPDDDVIAVYNTGDTTPAEGSGFKRYSFNIPSNATSLPKGWNVYPLGFNAPANPDWNSIITNVSRLGFYFADWEYFYIFQMWQAGVDNISISEGGTLAPLSGTITADGLTNVARGGIKLQLRDPVTLNPLYTFNVHAGDYELLVPAGVYNVGVNGVTFLRTARPLTVPSVGAANFTLRNGDVDGNNVVDDFDLFALTTDFLTYFPDANTDLTGDDAVDDFDLFALTSSFLQRGDN